MADNSKERDQVLLKMLKTPPSPSSPATQPKNTAPQAAPLSKSLNEKKNKKQS
jgi:hypothetical protein